MTKSILFSPLYGLGDVIMTTPAIKLLKDTLKDSVEISFVTMTKVSYAILSNNPYIDKLLYIPMLGKKIEGIKQYIEYIPFKYDIIINPYPSNRLEYNIFSFLSFAKKRIGHRYIHCDFTQLNWLKNLTVKESEELHCVEENVRLLEFLGVRADEIPPMQIYLKPEEVSKGQRISFLSNKKLKVGIHTGSSSFKNHKNRRLPKEVFLEVVNSFPDIVFFVFGTNEEKKENLFLKRNSIHGNVILIENYPIRLVASIMKNLNLFISNDSGLMHLAAAVGLPVVAIFGPTNPKWVKPWKVKHKIVKLNLDCSPCFVYSPKPLECTRKNEKFKCIKDITGEMVIKAVEELLNA